MADVYGTSYYGPEDLEPFKDTHDADADKAKDIERSETVDRMALHLNPAAVASSRSVDYGEC